jgi:cell division protein FtsL
MTITAKLATPGSRPRTTRKPGLNAYRAIADVAGNLRFYQDVPLRFQKQWITSFLAIVLVLSVVSGVYLNVIARAAITGREIQNLEIEITAAERVNADLETDIATQLSNKKLENRALASGFTYLQQADIEYLVVPGYFPQQGVSMISPVSNTDVLVMPPEFSESLFSWIARQMETASMPLVQVR